MFLFSSTTFLCCKIGKIYFLCTKSLNWACNETEDKKKWLISLFIHPSSGQSSEWKRESEMERWKLKDMKDMNFWLIKSRLLLSFISSYSSSSSFLSCHQSRAEERKEKERKKKVSFEALNFSAQSLLSTRKWSVSFIEKFREGEEGNDWREG